MRAAAWRAAGVAGLALVAATVFPFGCGKPTPPPPAKVSGSVAFQGRPLSGGLIVFVPDFDKGNSGKMLAATVQHDGGFQLADGAAVVTPGWYRVAVSDPPGYFDGVFPAPLRRPDRSGLEREVKPGHEHHFDFAIETTR